MRTTIFYQLFLTFPSLLFEFIGQPAESAEGYKFTAAEVKEKAFRFDGIFMPDRLDQPIYFVEVQFQDQPDFYWEFITEINIYLNQYKPVQDWRAIAIFAKSSLEVETLTAYQQELINSDRIVRIYLDQLPSGSIGLGLIELITGKEAQAPELVKQLLQRQAEITDSVVKQEIIELLLECLVSKFSKLSRQEIESMFLVSDIAQTRVYQEAKQEGREEGRQEGKQEGQRSLLLQLLSKRFGRMTNRYKIQIADLEIEQLEELGETLLDFKSIVDFDHWLETKKQ
jgi:predicted transposase/invertase (TIGR01784 family)